MDPGVLKTITLLCLATLLCITVVAVVPGGHTDSIGILIGFSGSVATSLFTLAKTHETKAITAVAASQQADLLEMHHAAQRRQEQILGNQQHIFDRLTSLETHIPPPDKPV